MSANIAQTPSVLACGEDVRPLCGQTHNTAKRHNPPVTCGDSPLYTRGPFLCQTFAVSSLFALSRASLVSMGAAVATRPPVGMACPAAPKPPLCKWEPLSLREQHEYATRPLVAGLAPTEGLWRAEALKPPCGRCHPERSPCSGSRLAVAARCSLRALRGAFAVRLVSLAQDDTSRGAVEPQSGTERSDGGIPAGRAVPAADRQ